MNTTPLQQAQQQVTSLTSQIAASKATIITLQAQLVQAQINHSDSFLQNQVDEMALLCCSTAKALKMPADNTNANLPTWAAHVMSKLPANTVL
jgi:hypothetical protein